MRSRQSCRTMLASRSTPMTISYSRFNNHNFSIYSFNVVNHRRCIMLNLNKTITVGWPWWWDRQSQPIQQVKRFPKTQASKMITQECSFCSGLVWRFLLLPPPCTGMWIAKQTWGALCLSNWSWRKNYHFFKYSGRQSTCLHTAPMPTVWALLYLATGGENNNDNDDDSSPLQPKAPLTFEFILTPNVQQTKCENSSILLVIYSWL